MKQLIRLKINNEYYELAVVPQRTLLEVLREDLGLTGTKFGCDTGECGACTVIIEGKTVLACMTLAVEVQDKDILTIEGLAQKGKLHPIQKSFIEHGAIQCGYCTSGMILSAKVLLDRVPKPTEKEVKKAIEGNLCRCTGYNKIIEAIMNTASFKNRGTL